MVVRENLLKCFLCGVQRRGPAPAPAPLRSKENCSSLDTENSECNQGLFSGPAEEILRLQQDLSSVTGVRRLTRVQSIFAETHATYASVYGYIPEDDVFILLTSGGHPYADGIHAAGSLPLPSHAGLLQRILLSRRPASELISQDACNSAGSSTAVGSLANGAHAASPVLASAVPLIDRGALVGALLLDFCPDLPPPQPHASSPPPLGPPASPLDGHLRPQSPPPPQPPRPGGTSMRSPLHLHPATGRIPAGSAPFLERLGVAASVALAADCEQLRCRASAVRRVARSGSMHALVGELSDELAAYVRRRYIISGAVRAALSPRPDAPVGLLFQAQHHQQHQVAHQQQQQDVDMQQHLQQQLPQQQQQQQQQQQLLQGTASLGAVLTGGRPSGKQGGAAASGGAGELITAGSDALRSGGRTSTDPQALPAGVLGASAGASGKMGMLLGNGPSRQRLMGTGTGTGPTSGMGSDLGAPRNTRLAACTQMLLADSSSSARVLALANDGTGRPTDHSGAGTVCSSHASRVIVVQMHAGPDGPTSPPGLHAQAFPLRHTLLQALAGTAADRGGCGGTAAAGPLPGAFRGASIEDVALYVQNVHLPSRDVYLLMGLPRVLAPGGFPGSPRTGPPSASASVAGPNPFHTSGQCLGHGFGHSYGGGPTGGLAGYSSGLAGAGSGGLGPAGPSYGGSSNGMMVGGAGYGLAGLSTGGVSAGQVMLGSGGNGGGNGGAVGAVQSLVLVGMPLGESVLAFYLCFAKRLPVELLEAVREGCQELLQETLLAPVRSKLEGPLAAEFETLRSPTPGHFAILRSSSVNGLAMHRPPSAGGLFVSAGSGTKTAPLAPPRSACGHRGLATAASCGAAAADAAVPTCTSCRGVCLTAHAAAAAAAASVGAGTGDVAGAVAGAAAGMSAPGQGVSRLRRRASMDLSCTSSAEMGGAFTTAHAVAQASAGSSRPRAVAICVELGPNATAPGTGTTGGRTGTSTSPAPGPTPTLHSSFVTRQPSAGTGTGTGMGTPVIQPAATPNDELLDVLLQMRHSETTACSQGDPRSASIMTVTGMDPMNFMRQQLDMLVTSIQTTMTTEVQGGVTGSPSEDLEQLELLEVLGKGGGGIVYKGRLGTQEVAVKVMELPDADVGECDGLNIAAGSVGTGTGTGMVDTATATALLGGGGSLPTTPRAANVGGGGGGLSPAATAAIAKEQLKARRALLRNAMEMAVQGRVSHPNLIQVYATYTNVLLEKRRRGDGSLAHSLILAENLPHDLGLTPSTNVCCAIVAELADGGSLAGALSARTFPRIVLAAPPRQAQAQAQAHMSTSPRPGAPPEQHPFQLDMKGLYMTLLDVALALRHLHSLNLVHRDVKPANLLLKINPRDHRGFTVKLADFGFVLHLNEVAEDGTRYITVDQACGTVTHMAPELLPGKARVDASADVYSFGIVMWELVSGGVRPFPHLHPDLIPRQVYKGARPIFGEAIPLSYRVLAQACWSTDPHRRPKASDLVSHLNAQLHEFD